APGALICRGPCNGEDMFRLMLRKLWPDLWSMDCSMQKNSIVIWAKSLNALPWRGRVIRPESLLLVRWWFCCGLRVIPREPFVWNNYGTFWPRPILFICDVRIPYLISTS